MIYPLWTAKSGAGCSVLALALAARLARLHRSSVLLVDLGGDLTAAAGLADPVDGVTDWLAASTATDDALGRLELDVGDSDVSLLPTGTAREWQPDRAELLSRLLAVESRPVVVDVGTIGPTVGDGGRAPMHDLRLLLAAGEPSLLVTRACYLALRRAVASPVRPTGVILVRESGRSLDRYDVADVVGVPVVAEIDHDPQIARAVDSGRIMSRCPRLLSRQVGAVTR